MEKLWIILCACLLAFSAYAEKITLEEAMKAKKLHITVKGNGGYSGACLKLEATNLTNAAFEVLVEAGTRFRSADEAEQDLMITKELLFALTPKGKSNIALFAMCIQSHNMSPQVGSTFFFDQMASGDLLKIARLISEKDYQNSTAQSAVWAISSGGAIQDIYGSDTSMVRHLAGLVGSALGVSMSAFNFQPRQHSLTSIRSSLEILLPENTEGMAMRAYLKSSGALYRELFESRSMVAGFQQLRFGINHTLGDSATFIVKLETSSGEVLFEREVTPNDVIPKLIKLPETYVTFNVSQPCQAISGIYDEQDRMYVHSGKPRDLQAGFHRFDFTGGRDLPQGNRYFYKVKDLQGNTLASQELSAERKVNEQFRPITKRGVYKFKMKEEFPKSDLNMGIYDAQGNFVWQIFENSRLTAGNKEIPYVFQHRQGPEATFFIKLTDKEGNILKEECIVNCK